jgi:3-phosphoshikimate 1-carboxyvinyltransferase
MGDYLALPTHAIQGTLVVPGDKSISHRAIMLAGIAEGVSHVRAFLASEDCLATLAAMRALGVGVEQTAADAIRVHGAGLRGLKGAGRPLDMGNAGTAMRLFTGLLSAQHFDSELFGDASLMKRPMERVAIPLRLMGADVRTASGKPPVIMHAVESLKAIDYALPVASAQLKSALLLAGLYADGTTRITEPAVSRDHSERMLLAMGADVSVDGRLISINSVSRLLAQDIDVPGDFSSAAFFIVAALLAADAPVTIRNVGLNPTRIGLLHILESMGAKIGVEAARHVGSEPVADLVVRRSELRGVRVPPEAVPLAIDEFPVLFIAAACARGETLITGAQELRVKESDRLAVMSEGLKALGVEHELLMDGLRIAGTDRADVFGGGTIDSHGDHRIAMAFAIASLRATAPIRIRDTANVATSFPGFLSCARSLGMRLDDA